MIAIKFHCWPEAQERCPIIYLLFQRSHCLLYVLIMQMKDFFPSSPQIWRWVIVIICQNKLSSFTCRPIILLAFFKLTCILLIPTNCIIWQIPKKGNNFFGGGGMVLPCMVCCPCRRGHIAFTLDYFYNPHWPYFLTMIIFNGTCIHSFFFHILVV